jgi:AraC family transcriptional regulator
MADVAVIARAIDYVEAHLQEDISVADMAAAVSYSLFHFSRMFNQATHQTPYDYLIRRRLTESAHALVQTDAKIIDVAFDYQFNSPETFSRAFKRLFGIQPRQWRGQAFSDPCRLVPRLTPAHLRHIAKGHYLKPVLAEKDAFTIVGIMTLLGSDRPGAQDLWDLLARELEGLDKSPAQRSYYGITYHPEGRARHGVPYMAGIRDPGLEVAGTALVSKAVPPLQCARFIHKGSARELQLTLDYVYHTWLPRSGMHLTLPWVLEHFGHDIVDAGNPDSEWEVYIPIQS